METGKQIASMETWRHMSGADQAEIASRAAKRAAYIARSYGAELTADELWGETWAGIVTRLDADYLDRHNQRREQPLTLWQIAFRAAHAAAELWRWNYNRDKDMLPLECWAMIDNSSMEDGIINRLAIDDCMAGLDSRGKSIMELTASGYTERETGKAIGISGVAVHKRLTRIRKDLQAAIA